MQSGGYAAPGDCADEVEHKPTPKISDSYDPPLHNESLLSGLLVLSAKCFSKSSSAKCSKGMSLDCAQTSSSVAVMAAAVGVVVIGIVIIIIVRVI